jgi:hypothetical protein
MFQVTHRTEIMVLKETQLRGYERLGGHCFQVLKATLDAGVLSTSACPSLNPRLLTVNWLQTSLRSGE